MAVKKVRSFEYRPPRRRLEQMGERRHRIELPRPAGASSSAGLRLVIMLALIIGLAVLFAVSR